MNSIMEMKFSYRILVLHSICLHLFSIFQENVREHRYYKEIKTSVLFIFLLDRDLYTLKLFLTCPLLKITLFAMICCKNLTRGYKTVLINNIINYILYDNSDLCILGKLYFWKKRITRI